MGTRSEFTFPFDREIEDTQEVEVDVSASKGNYTNRTFTVPPGKRLRITIELEEAWDK